MATSQNSFDCHALQSLACSRLSVSGDDPKSEWATSGISDERDPGLLFYLYQTPLVARLLFRSSPLTKSLKQAIHSPVLSRYLSRHATSFITTKSCSVSPLVQHKMARRRFSPSEPETRDVNKLLTNTARECFKIINISEKANLK